MKPNLRSVCVILGGLMDSNKNLQPWRYLLEVCRQLSALGHRVTLITDSGGDLHLENDLTIVRVPSVSSPFWKPNKDLHDALGQVNCEVVVVNLGFLSFLHQDFNYLSKSKKIGVITSPFYRLVDFWKVGIKNTLSSLRLCGILLLTACIPVGILRTSLSKHDFDAFVVQSSTLRDHLVKNNMGGDSIHVISPGVDPVWLISSDNDLEMRQALGFNEEDWVVVFFGSPAPLRGLPDLVKAVKIARGQIRNLKLLILSRPSNNSNPHKRFVRLADHITLVDDQLSPPSLSRYINASDIVALPFQMIPSDVPLSVLESRALGKPVITTRTACLPELVECGDHYLAHPADPRNLSWSIVRAWESRKDHYGNTFDRIWSDMGKDWSSLIQKI